MEKDNYSQLELFSGNSQTVSPKPSVSSRVLSFLKSYERAILLAMGFLITCLIAFALGVERGRRYASSLSLPRPPPGQAAQAMAPPVKVAVAARQLIAQREMSINNPPLASGFTVQIASYQKREYAQREALSLNKRGITAIVIPKGSYFILCAGRFSDRRDAEQLLGRLKKQYRDCWIRRM